MNVLLGYESFLSVQWYAVKFCNILSFNHHHIAMEQDNAAGVKMKKSGGKNPLLPIWAETLQPILFFW